MVKYIIFGGVTTVSFIVASVAASLIAPNNGPDRPGDMKQPIERYSPPPKTEQVQTKQDLGDKNKDKGNSPKHEQIEAHHDDQHQLEEESVAATPQPAQRPAPRIQQGPSNIDAPSVYRAPVQQGPGNIDSGYIPAYNNQSVNLGPGNL